MFDFDSGEIAEWNARLSRHFGRLIDPPRRAPVGQLVRSMIGGRTRDEVALGAYRRIGHRWPRAADLARADAPAIERVISDVTFADAKARHLPAALAMIGADFPDYALAPLAAAPVEQARALLERYPGVGPKVAAATLNASTLRRPIFIVDSHVHRVMVRLGIISAKATPRFASELVTASGQELGADGLLELFAQMKRLGQELCRFETPACAACPLAPRCRTARRGRG